MNQIEEKNHEDKINIKEELFHLKNNLTETLNFSFRSIEANINSNHNSRQFEMLNNLFFNKTEEIQKNYLRLQNKTQDQYQEDLKTCQKILENINQDLKNTLNSSLKSIEGQLTLNMEKLEIFSEKNLNNSEEIFDKIITIIQLNLTQVINDLFIKKIGTFNQSFQNSQDQTLKYLSDTTRLMNSFDQNNLSYASIGNMTNIN